MSMKKRTVRELTAEERATITTCGAGGCSAPATHRLIEHDGKALTPLCEAHKATANTRGAKDQ